MARRLLLATVCIRLWFCLSPQSLAGQDTANSALPRDDAKAGQVDYLKQIKPLFRQRESDSYRFSMEQVEQDLGTLMAA